MHGIMGSISLETLASISDETHSRSSSYLVDSSNLIPIQARPDCRQQVVNQLCAAVQAMYGSGVSSPPPVSVSIPKLAPSEMSGHFPQQVYPTSGVAVRRPERRLPNPLRIGASCEHVKSWVRLRGKKGFAYYECQQCNTRWRIPMKGNTTFLQLNLLRQVGNATVKANAEMTATIPSAVMSITTIGSSKRDRASQSMSFSQSDVAAGARFCPMLSPLPMLPQGQMNPRLQMSSHHPAVIVTGGHGSSCSSFCMLPLPPPPSAASNFTGIQKPI